MKNYYEILGVSEDATDEEIKKVFRKKSVQFHPDRQVGKSEEEKKQAEDMFKEINEAYQTLSDPQKKEEYDLLRKGGGNPFAGFNPFDIFGGNPFDIFSGGSRHNNSRVVRTGADVFYNLDVKIEDILSGINKDINYKRNIRCHCCNGLGGETSMCPDCKGTGFITKTVRTAFGIVQNSSVCSRCSGTRKVVTKKCSCCSGTGYEDKEDFVHFVLSPDKVMNDGSRYKYRERGTESLDLDGPCGDLFIKINHSFDHRKYEITPEHNIIETITIPYYDCILGIPDMIINIPSEGSMRVALPECTQGDSLIEVPGVRVGLEGKYYLKIKIGMPSTIGQTEKSLLNGIKSIS